MKKILCLIMVMSVFHSVLWGFAYDGSGQISTYPGGSSSSGQPAPNMQGYEDARENCEEEIESLDASVSSVNSNLPNEEAVDSVVAQNDSTTDDRDLSLETNIAPLVSENNTVVENNENETQAEETGDPVRVSTGEYIQHDTDITLKNGFSFERRYGLHNDITGIFGSGWSSTFDERILLGKEPGIEELYEKQKNRTSWAYEKVFRMNDSIISNYHVSSVTNAQTELEKRLQNAQSLKTQAENLLNSAISFFNEGSTEIQSIKNNINTLTDICNRYTSSLSLLKVHISKYNSYFNRYSQEVDKRSALNKVLKASQNIKNTFSNYSGTPESWVYCGLGNILFIDKDSTPHVFKNYNNEWKKDSSVNNIFLNIRKNDEEQYILTYIDNSKKIFNSEGLLVKIINNRGDFLVIERDDDCKITSVKTSFNEEYIFNYSNPSSNIVPNSFVTSIQNKRDPADKISFTYNSNNLSSVTDSDGDKVSFVYNYSKKLSALRKSDGSSIQLKSFYNNDIKNFIIYETRNEEGFSEFFDYDFKARKTIYRDQDGNETVFFFDTKFRTTKKIENTGDETEYNYDSHGNIIKQNKNGLITEYQYDSENKLTKTFYADGTTESYFYDEYGNPISYTDRDGYSIPLNENSDSIIYEYDKYGNIISAVSEKHRMNLVYDARNRITSLSLDGDEKISVSYGNHFQSTKYNTGLKITKTYNNRKDLIEEKEEDPAENTVIIYKYEYDKRHLPRKKSIYENGDEKILWEKSYTPKGLIAKIKEYDDFDCWITEYDYENSKLCSETKWKESEPDKKIINKIHEEIDYGNKIITTLTNSLGSKTWYRFNGDGYLTSFINEEEEIFNFSFSPAGRLLSDTDKFGKQNYYEYDIKGNIIEDEKKVESEKDFYKTYEYDSYGRIIKMTDGEGNSNRCHYNALGQIDKVYDGYDNCTLLKYNAKNQIVKKLFPDGTSVSYEYDAGSSLTKITDDLGTVWQGEYDPTGNLIYEKGRGINESFYTYDKTGRLTSVKIGETILEKYDYSNYGRNIVFTDGNGNKLFQTLDENGKLTTEINRLGETKNYSQENESLTDKEITWDDEGKIIYAANGSSSFEYSYNEMGLLDSFTDIPAMETVSYEYDKAGRKTRIKSSNRDVNFFYGANNELIEIRDNLTKLSVRFYYDKMMREIRREYGNQTSLDFYYDKAGRMTAFIEKDISGKIINGEGYLYGSDGRRCASVDFEGAVTFFNYDNLGHISSVSYPASFEYTNHLKKEAEKIGLNIDEMSFTPESSFLSSDITLALQLLLENYIPGFSVSSNYLFFKEDFSYDNNGNRLTHSFPFGELEYFYDSENRLISICFLKTPVVEYQYDINGNLSQKVSKSSIEKYSYSAENRLTDYVRTDNGKVTTCHYTYDVFGRRQLTVRNGKAALRCLYDGFSFDLIKESPVFSNGIFTDNFKNVFFMTAETDLNERYIFINDSENYDSFFEESFPLCYNGKIFGREIGNRTEYFGTEILGNVKSITDHFGNIEKSFSYDVFGTPVSEVKPAYGYNGKPYDSITGFYNYGFRDYSPDTSRFTSSDPIRDGTNWYLYCSADPVNYVDLWGLDMLRMTYIKGSNKLQIVKFPVNEYGDVIANEVKRVGEFEVSNNVRNELNGLREEPNALTSPVSGTPEYYYPRDFPTGTWKVYAPRESTNPEIKGLFIPTNAVQEVPVYGKTEEERLQDDDGNFLPTGTQLDSAYGLHACNSSSYTQGCIRLKDINDSKQIVNIINEVLATKGGVVNLLVMEFEYPSENK